MRCTEERVAAVHKRAVEIKHEQRVRQSHVVSVLAFAASLCVAIAMAVILPQFAGVYFGQGLALQQEAASVFYGSGALTYVVVAVLAFILGVSVTVFSVLLRHRVEANREMDDDD